MRVAVQEAALGRGQEEREGVAPGDPDERVDLEPHVEPPPAEGGEDLAEEGLSADGLGAPEGGQAGGRLSGDRGEVEEVEVGGAGELEIGSEEPGGVVPERTPRALLRREALGQVQEPGREAAQPGVLRVREERVQAGLALRAASSPEEEGDPLQALPARERRPGSLHQGGELRGEAGEGPGLVEEAGGRHPDRPLQRGVRHGRRGGGEERVEQRGVRGLGDVEEERDGRPDRGAGVAGGEGGERGESAGPDRRFPRLLQRAEKPASFLDPVDAAHRRLQLGLQGPEGLVDLEGTGLARGARHGARRQGGSLESRLQAIMIISAPSRRGGAKRILRS